MCALVQLESEFEERWMNGEVPGWGNKSAEKEAEAEESEIDLGYYSTVEELVELGPEKLKQVILATLYCYGAFFCSLFL